MKPLTVDQVQQLRTTQAMWRRIAEDPRIRLSARENAAQHVATIEAQIVRNRTSVERGAFGWGMRHG